MCNILKDEPCRSDSDIAHSGNTGSSRSIIGNRSSRLENITGMIVTKGIVVCNQTEGPATESLDPIPTKILGFCWILRSILVIQMKLKYL